MRARRDLSEVRAFIYYRDRGLCRGCGLPVTWPGQLGHIVPQDKVNLARYGEAVVHHPDNMALVHPKQACNDSVSIRGDYEAVDRKAREIRAKLEE